MDIGEIKSSSEEVIKEELTPAGDEYSNEVKVPLETLDPFGWLKEEHENDPPGVDNSEGGEIQSCCALNVETQMEDDFTTFLEGNDSDNSDVKDTLEVDHFDASTTVKQTHSSTGIPLYKVCWQHFQTVFPDAWIDHVIKEANDNGRIIFQSEEPPAGNKNGWRELTRQEFLVFLSLCFMMTVIRIPRLEDYWKKNRLFNLTLFDHMSLKRFKLITKVLNSGQAKRKKPESVLLRFRKLLKKAYNLHCKFSSKYISSYDFKIKIIDILISKVGHHYTKPVVDQSDITFHFPTNRPLTNNTKGRKHCRVCWKKKIRRQVSICCPDCEGQPGLCLEGCFKEYHQIRNQGTTASVGVKVFWNRRYEHRRSRAGPAEDRKPNKNEAGGVQPSQISINYAHSK